MGKMKYVATEDILQQSINRKHKTPKFQYQHSALGPLRPERGHTQQPINTLLRQLYLRFRRIWIAFQFQGNRFTMGVFRERSSLKIGALTTLCYFMFFSDQQIWLFSASQLDESVQIGPVETALEVTEKGEGKSIDWNLTAGPKKQTVNSSKKTSNLDPDRNPAPMFPGQMRGQGAEQYIARYSKIAVQEMHKYGIPASISLAQGLVESRYGTSKLAVKNNNHFGMKCFSKKCGDGHCSNFFDDHHKDFFRKYKTPWESWRAHSQMLANGRYARLKKHGRNYKNWAYGLESLGYATDRTYAEKIIGVVQKYNLSRFDR